MLFPVHVLDTWIIAELLVVLFNFRITWLGFGIRIFSCPVSQIQELYAENPRERKTIPSEIYLKMLHVCHDQINPKIMFVLPHL